MTILSTTALARIAERHIRDRGPMTVADLLPLLATVAANTERAEAGIRQAVVHGRLELDRDATLRVPDQAAA